MKKLLSLILLVINFTFFATTFTFCYNASTLSGFNDYSGSTSFTREIESTHGSSSLEEEERINYNETLETFSNPERGFYEPLGLHLKPTDNKVLNYSSNLVHLRVNLSAFSGKNNGVGDLELTDDALDTLSKTLQNVKAKGGSVIIRFAYDSFDGKANVEPSLEMILRHIEQLKSVFYRNRDVITYVELGFFGPWGEMHTSKVSTTENVSLAIDKMLESVPEEISIGVRTPNYFAAWAGIERSSIDTFKSLKGTKYYRVGLYNDGYLGSESDLGTFHNREKEVKWLSEQAKHTLYGGEVVGNFGKVPLNTVEYMSKEAFLTHTTYLNLRWNYQTIDNWKKEIYNGEDTLYVGQTGFKYIDNHLGYRFVLRNSTVTTNNGNMDINLDIENVGFANLINKKRVTIVLESDENTYEIRTDIDPTAWDSKSTVNINKEIKLPENIPLGNYRVYLRISYYGDLRNDNNYKAIRLANDEIWNSEIGANYIGKVEVKEYVPPKEEEVEPPKNPEDDKPVIPQETEEVVHTQKPSTVNKPNNEHKKDEVSSNASNNEEYPKNESSNQNVNEEKKDEEKVEDKKNSNSLVYIIGGLIGIIILGLIIKISMDKF